MEGPSVFFWLENMAAFYRSFLFAVFFLLFAESFSVPLDDAKSGEESAKVRRFRGFIPKTLNMRFPRAEGEGQESGGGLGEMIMTAIKDGIAASSLIDSPTMFVGGFSVMMQPMPNGSEVAGQFMQMAPNFLNFLPGAGGK